MRWPAALAVVATFGAASCGGDSVTRTPQSDRERQTDKAWMALDEIDGALLFTCGAEPFTSDAYLKSEAGTIPRLTKSPARMGVTDAVLHGDTIVVVAGTDGLDTLRRRRLTTPPERAGRKLRLGRSPAVSATGRLAYTQLAGDKDGKLMDAVVVASPRPRVIARLSEVWRLFWVGKRLFAIAERGTGGRRKLVETNATSATRTVRMKGRRVGATAASKQGKLAYTFGREHSRRLAIMQVNGTGRRVFRSRWTPVAWAPDGARLLVQSSDTDTSQLGLMDPHTGEIQRLGTLDCGWIVSAEWRPTDPKT